MENEQIKTAILETLEGIKKAPRMYGGPETLEALVFVLLSLLEPSEKVRKAFEAQANRLAGHATCTSLSSFAKTEEEMIQILKLVQDEVLKTQNVVIG